MRCQSPARRLLAWWEVTRKATSTADLVRLRKHVPHCARTATWRGQRRRRQGPCSMLSMGCVPTQPLVCHPLRLRRHGRQLLPCHLRPMGRGEGTRSQGQREAFWDQAKGSPLGASAKPQDDCRCSHVGPSLPLAVSPVLETAKLAATKESRSGAERQTEVVFSLWQKRIH